MTAYNDIEKAKEQTREYNKQIDEDLNPFAESNPIVEDETLQDLFDLFIKKSVDRKGKPLRPSTINGYEYAFEADILPYLGEVKVKDLRKKTIIKMLDKIIDRGSHNQANQTYRRLKRVLAFAAARDIIEASPMSSMEPVGVTKSRSRILSDEEIKTFMAWRPKSDEAWRILRLVLITGARPGEIAGLCKAEIQGDWLEIPPERSKTNTLNRIFLTDMAKELLPEDRFTISRHAVSRSLRRSIVTGKPYLADKDKQVVQKVGGQIYPLPLQSFVPHDLRRTMASQLAELGFSDEIIDATQGRVKRGIIGTYNRYRYDKECQLAAEAWTRKLQGIITGKKSDNVIPMAR
jgi:integrase